MTRRLLALTFTFVSAAFATEACQPVPGETPPTDVKDPPASSGAVPGASASAAPVSSAEATPPAVSDAKTFACGKTQCKVGESCCSASDDGKCVPTVAPGPNDKTQYLASQLEACGNVKLEYSLDAIKRCDESIDCAKNETCCEQELFGGAMAQVCVPTKPGGKVSTCGIKEVCIGQGGCRASGAECVSGVCSKVPKELKCGTATCSGDKNACCGDPATCKAASECTEMPRFACTKASDCLPGEQCMNTMAGTGCTSYVDLTNSGLVCEKDSDCPSASGFCPKMKCAPIEPAWLKTCQCP